MVAASRSSNWSMQNGLRSKCATSQLLRDSDRGLVHLAAALYIYQVLRFFHQALFPIFFFFFSLVAELSDVHLQALLA